MSEPTDGTRVWLTRVSLAAGVAFTATAEYQLARTLGAVPPVAAMLPLSIDAYVVAALRWFRPLDIALSLALMGAAQVAAHLLDAHVMTVNIPMVVVVSLLVPVSIWRTHALARNTDAVPETSDRDLSVDAPQVSVERVPEPPRVRPAAPVPAVLEAVPAAVQLLPIVARPDVHQPTPVLAAEQTRTRPEVHAEYVPDPVLDEAEEPEGELTPHGIGLAAEHFKYLLVVGKYPTIRAIKDGLGVGQSRATELQAALKEGVEKLAREQVRS